MKFGRPKTLHDQGEDLIHEGMITVNIVALRLLSEPSTSPTGQQAHMAARPSWRSQNGCSFLHQAVAIRKSH
jgi:hypothetical protein